MPDDDSLDDQLAAAKRLLEYDHGRALTYGTHEEARAFYKAIRTIEDAQAHNWDTESVLCRERDELSQQFFDTSREAREEGVRAAQAWDKRERPNYATEDKSLFDVVADIFR